MTARGSARSVVLHRVSLPLRTPLRSAHGVESTRETILVEVRDGDGPSGWGECPALLRPTYTGEYVDGAWRVLRDHLAPAFVADVEAGVVGHPMAAGALADARADATLRRLDRSLVGSVANRIGPVRAAADRTAVLGEAEPEVTLGRVADRLADGVAAIKLKVSGRPRSLAAVEAVRDRHPDLALAVDANGSLDQRGLGRLDDLGLLYIEQPAPAGELVLSARWARNVRTPIALDESVDGPGSVEVAAALAAGSVINVKPARLGGVDAAVETVRVAAHHELDVFVGGMWESGVGRCTALAIAASTRCTLPTDSGPPTAHLESDVLETAPLLDEAGRVVVPDGPGFGGVVDRDRLDDRSIDRIVVG